MEDKALFQTSILTLSPPQRFLSQLAVMLRRNAILSYRYFSSTVAQTIFAPFLFTLLIFILQAADHANQSIQNAHPPLGSLQGLYPCQGHNLNDPCISIMYTGASNGVVDYSKIMQTFATKNNVRTGYTFNMESALSDPTFTPTKSLDIVPVPSSDFIYSYALSHPNTTAWGISFSETGVGSSINIQYQIWFNATSTANSTSTSSNDIFGRTILSFMRGVDEAIISVLNDPNVQIVADIDVNLKDWPLIAPTILSDQIVQQLGPVFFFCSEMLIFISVLNQIVTEKELKLRHGMEVMGLKPSVYWISHLITNTVFVFTNALFTVIWGLIFQFQAFQQTNFFVLFFTFFFFGEAMIMFAFFITTFVRKTRVAILIGIFLFILGLLFESFVFSGSYIGYIWWSTQTIPSTGWLVLMFLPFFNFGHMFLDITTLTTGLLDNLTQTYIPGPGFPWSSLYPVFPSTSLPNYGANGIPDCPAPIQAWYFLIMDCFVFGILLWYFDNVIADEYGMRKSYYFFLTPKYWGFEAAKSKSVEMDEWQAIYSKQGQPDEPNEDDDVVRERLVALDPKIRAPLKIINLRKVYRNFGSSEEKVAVRNSCFQVEEGKLLALLGQNGAGKSTTISMLAGLTPTTGGDALIYGYSVKNSMPTIRTFLGLCPQHDLLFDVLTAREHIQLYAGLKGVPQDQWEPLIQERLQLVRLLSVANIQAGTYSGGMKRRLSLVIATIGDPKILFLDEPTTGMDPVNRRHVWSFIEKFKKGRVVILTTHSMEEADVLGDRVCVMSKGRLRAINNSIALKNKFGEGYRISVVTDKIHVEEIVAKVKAILPDAILEDASAGALVFKFRGTSMSAIPKFIGWLEQNNDSMVKSWSISQSTLEEVFLKLIRESNELFAK